jgi:glucose/arabinose dehydrogenase
MNSTGLAALLLIVAASGAQGADVPGQHFWVSPASLPRPYATSAVDNSSQTIARPAGVMPKAPDGFAVSIFASSVPHARWMAVAPNGDVFLAESDQGKIVVLRPSADGTHAARVATFAEAYTLPHGLAFANGALYVADVKSIWRLSYADGQLKSTGRRRHIANTTPAAGVGHFTRDIVFDTKGNLFLTIGSRNNVDEEPLPYASVQRVNSDGSLSTFASGLRNPVGIAFYPGTDDLYVTVNERDGLGTNLPPDYLTRARQGEFFGWPYAYTGTHPDPDFGKKRPDLVAKSKTPDVLFQPHSAPLGLVFYEGGQFPSEYKGDAFVSLHGSWNAAEPTGYKVVRVRFSNGRPQNGYENFVTGFWDGKTSPARVWGRPVGLVVAKDGSLLIADDVGGVVWRVAYKGK